MMHSSLHYRRRQTARQQQNRRNARITAFIAALSGILLLAGGAYLYWSGQQAPAAAAYAAADVAHEAPFVAIHEMGEGPPVPFLPAGGPQPKISVPETSFNFGRIGPQDKVEQTFIIRNDGEAPLTISRAYTTCGCTQAEFSARVIPPGNVATVKVIFDAGFHDAAGQTVRRGIIIESNDPSRSQAEIWVQAAINLK